ncbi:MAG: NADH-quinone oxidoreductase subunit C [Gammaproteobacteria bacterium]|nr:NADH-quinone oxidoreductase subunit C [Gammaproteobacteria bacterium]
MADQFPVAKIIANFNGRVSIDSEVTDMACVVVKPIDLVELCLFLRDNPAFKFNFMTDIGGVDFFPNLPRFQLVYHLYSIDFGWRLRIKCPLEDPPKAPTITEIWTTANWHEREAYDMYGIVFEDHPDLRRIYMWQDFEGWPMRRDFPLRGYKDKYNPFGEEKPGADQDPIGDIL